MKEKRKEKRRGGRGGTIFRTLHRAVLHTILEENNEKDTEREMAQSQTTWAQVAWRKNEMPYAPTYNDGYFFEADPAAEAHHVFCEGLALPEAWETFFDDNNTFRIVELGFGTGMTFLQTAQEWLKWQEPETRKSETRKTEKLDYWGIEAYPLRLEDMQRFYRHHKTCGSERLLQAWKEIAWQELQSSSETSLCQPVVPLIRWQLAPSLRLTLLLQDVDSALAALPHEVDGWYCDGFAPRSNPAMWSEGVFSALARCTRVRASFPQLASFSVAKSVRTAAEAYGFRTHKRKGWMAKREVLQGFFQENKEAGKNPAPLP